MTTAIADRVQLGMTGEAVYGTTPSGALSAKTTVSVVASDQSYNDSTEDLSVFKAGQFIRVSGFTDSNNNGDFQVVSATANKMIVRGMNAVPSALADEAMGDTITIISIIQNIRFTGESLHQEQGVTNSAEIRPDRQVVDVVRNSVGASGDINYEFSYGAFDVLMEAVLFSDAWSTELEDIDGDITIAAVASTNRLTDSGNNFGSYTVGEIIKISGFTITGNNGYALIDAVAAGYIDLNTSWITLADEAAGDTVYVTQGSKIENGTTQRQFTIERSYEDIGSMYAVYKGMTPSNMSMTIAPDAIINGTMGFLGSDEEQATSSVSAGDADEPAANLILNGIDNVYAMMENYTARDTTQITLEINNNLRERMQIGTLGAVSIGAGKIALSGTIQAYFADATVIQKFLDCTTSNLTIIFEDSAGNVYLLWMPMIKYTSGQRVAGGENSDIIEDMAWSAFRDSTSGITFRIVRFPV